MKFPVFRPLLQSVARNKLENGRSAPRNRENAESWQASDIRSWHWNRCLHKIRGVPLRWLFYS